MAVVQVIVTDIMENGEFFTEVNALYISLCGCSRQSLKASIILSSITVPCKS